MAQRKPYSKRDAEHWRSMKLRELEELEANPPPGFVEWSAEQARAIGAQAAEGIRKLHELTDSVRLELEAAIVELGELEPWQAVDAIRKIRAAGSKRASKMPRNRQSPYAGELKQWRIKAAAERALHADAGAPELAAAIKTGTGTRAAVRYLRAWVSANLDAIDERAAKAREKARMRP